MALVVFRMDEFALSLVNAWILVPIGIFFRFIFVFSILLLFRRMWVSGRRRRISVVVLGDVGRSPRMSYHSLSLARHGFNVDLIGFTGSTPHPSLLESKKIQLHYVTEVRPPLGFPRMYGFLHKVVVQSCCLLWTMMVEVEAAESILVQNPPSIPTMAICTFISIWNGSKLVIDWHNYGFSILAMQLGKNHLLVKIAKLYEEIFGQLSSGNLCVTQAMQDDLFDMWKISADVMHDRPASIFRKLNIEEQHKLFTRLSESFPEFGCEGESRFTQVGENGVEMKTGRPAILVSSTSWTEDEDFSILLRGLELYEEHHDTDLPNILCIITGKGPQKSYYQQQISMRSWRKVQIITPWLAAEDYPRLLGSADLGVCLHTSSSGLDLPMKVVDMFGSLLPVVAVDFKCLSELVQHNFNGFIFTDPTQLCTQLVTVLRGFPQDRRILSRLSRGVEKFQSVPWDHAWDDIVLPLFQR